MKKKFFVGLFALALIVPGVILFIGCGEETPSLISMDIIEKDTGINHANSWDKGTILYGESPVLDDFNLVLNYSNNTTQNVQESDSKLSVVYTYYGATSEGEIIENLENLQVGAYEIKYTYEDSNIFQVFVYFTVEKAEYQGEYTASLSNNVVPYGEGAPTIEVLAQNVQIDEYYNKYLNEEQYAEYQQLTTKDEKQIYLEENGNYASGFYESVGQYYLYTKVISDNYADQYSIPVSFTVRPATLTKVENPNEATPTAKFSYDYLNDDVTVGDIKLSDIAIVNDFSNPVKYQDKYGHEIPGEFQWSSAFLNQTINFDEKGRKFPVVFVPYDNNYATVTYGSVAIEIEQGKIAFTQTTNSYEYREDNGDTFDFTIFLNTNSMFYPSEYINFYKWNGSNWQEFTVSGNGDVKENVANQVGQHKYKLELKDKTNFVWKMADGSTTTDDIEITKEITPAQLSHNISVDSATITEDGVAYLPVQTDDKVTNLKVEIVNKESNLSGGAGGLGEPFFKGDSAELVEIEGKTYIKVIVTEFCLADGTNGNSSTNTIGRVFFKLTGDSVDPNYVFNDIDGASYIYRLTAGPSTTDEAVVLTPGKTFRECFTFMLSEDWGTYTPSETGFSFNLYDTVPEDFYQTQLSLNFESNSPIYASGRITFNVELAKN